MKPYGPDEGTVRIWEVKGGAWVEKGRHSQELVRKNNGSENSFSIGVGRGIFRAAFPFYAGRGRRYKNAQGTYTFAKKDWLVRLDSFWGERERIIIKKARVPKG